MVIFKHYLMYLQRVAVRVLLVEGNGGRCCKVLHDLRCLPKSEQQVGKAKAELHPISVSDVWKQIGIDLIGE